MASMAELVKLQDQINALGVLVQEVESRMNVIDERLRGGAAPAAASAPAEDNSGLLDMVAGLEERMLKIEVAAAKGKPGRKAKHVQEAIEAEEAA